MEGILIMRKDQDSKVILMEVQNDMVVVAMEVAAVLPVVDRPKVGKAETALY